MLEAIRRILRTTARKKIDALGGIKRKSQGRTRVEMAFDYQRVVLFTVARGMYGVRARCGR